MHNAEITLPNYQVLRCDRADGRKQGGVLLVATPRFELRQVPIPSEINIDTYNFEVLCATIHLKSRFLFACCVVYIPPNCDESEYMLLFKLLEQICVRYKSNVVILGDFNMFSCNNNVKNYFEYFVAFSELVQWNNVPNCSGRQLDLVLSGRSYMEVCAAEEGLKPVDAYHPPLAVAVDVATYAQFSPIPAEDDLAHAQNPQLFNPYKRWNFHKVDFNYLYYSIGRINWKDIYSLQVPEEALDFYYSKMNEVFDDCVPIKKYYIRNNRYNYPVWYTADIIRDIKTKYILHKKYKASKTSCDYEQFSRYRAKVKMETELAHNRYRDRVQNHLANDPKAFWSYIRLKKGNSSQYKILKDGQVLSGGECAEEYARYFQTVYNTEPPTLSAEAASSTTSPSSGGAWAHLSTLERAAVSRALARLPPKRSVGPDGIPPFILRDCRMVLVEPLLHLFNIFIAAGRFPDLWKLTRVVPVPKGGGGTEASDYRPVAVLCAPAKVFESVIHNHLYAQVDAHLTDAQHGFRPGRGTTGNLLHLMTQVVPAVDAGRQVDVAYLDFKKAFDTVDHDVLLRKLAGIGFTLHTLKFFSTYFRDRRQYVDCGGHCSEPYYTRSGVSQGSNLGPLLFNLMINDLPSVINGSICLLFADDLKLICEIRDNADHVTLQQDIDRVIEWSHEFKLYFNVAKCSVLSYTRASSPRHHQYNMEGEPLQRVTEVKDLGIRFVSELHFRKHIMDVCKKAYRNLGFILRQANQFTNIAAVKALYEALVKSHLEYNAGAWSPHENKYKLMIERIQNKFTRFVYLKLYGVYPGYPLLYPTLFVLGMVGYYKLEVRREVALATYLFKVLRGKTHNPALLEELRLCVPDEYVWRRRRPRLLVVPCARTNLLQKAPLTRALHTLNTIADRMDLFTCTLNEFTRVTYEVVVKSS